MLHLHHDWFACSRGVATGLAGRWQSLCQAACDQCVNDFGHILVASTLQKTASSPVTKPAGGQGAKEPGSKWSSASLWREPSGAPAEVLSQKLTRSEPGPRFLHLTGQPEVSRNLLSFPPMSMEPDVVSLQKEKCLETLRQPFLGFRIALAKVQLPKCWLYVTRPCL